MIFNNYHNINIRFGRVFPLRERELGTPKGYPFRLYLGVPTK